MKVFPLTKKLSEFPVKSLEELRDDAGLPGTTAYIAAVIPNQDNYLIPVTDFNKVCHDNTLIGDGSPEYPLSVVGGGSSGSNKVFHDNTLIGDGSQEYPLSVVGGCSSGSGCGRNITINSPMNTIIVNQPTQYNYNLEGTNWGIRYNIDWDETDPVTTLNSIDGLVETEIIYETDDPALKFKLNDETSDIVTDFYVLTASDDPSPRLINSFTGDFEYNVDPDLIGNYYSLNIESSSPTVSDYSIDVYTGTVTKGTEPEELVFKSDFDDLSARVAELESSLSTLLGETDE